MPISFTVAKQRPKSPDAKAQGRNFMISMKGIPKVDAKEKARLEAAARAPESRKRPYPTIAL